MNNRFLNEDGLSWVLKFVTRNITNQAQKTECSNPDHAFFGVCNGFEHFQDF